LHKSEPRFHIDQKELEPLEKVKNLMNCDAKLYHKPKKTYESGISGETFRLQVYNQKIFNSLIKLGLVSDKSLKIEFPDIPTQYIRHFIRGCWDGDGSVYVEKDSGNICASFVSGSKQFIDGMVSELEKAGLKKRKTYTTKAKTPSYYFRFSGSQCKKLYHYLYDDVPPEQYLERKYQVFKKYFDERYKPLEPAKLYKRRMDLTKEAHNFAVKRHASCLSDMVKSRYLKVEWKCQQGHRFNASLASVKYYDSVGKFCPICEKLYP
jgi:hypothetical protein